MDKNLGIRIRMYILEDLALSIIMDCRTTRATELEQN